MFAFLILVGRCLEHGQGIAGLLLFSIDRYHAIAVVVVCSVAGAPRRLCAKMISKVLDGGITDHPRHHWQREEKRRATYHIQSHHSLSLD